MRTFVLGTALLLLAARWASAETNATQAGELRIEPPTLHALGFEWIIEGDDNRNGRVEVAYRLKGAGVWKPALPLLRIQHELAAERTREEYDCGNLYAGSVLDLAAGGEYEVRLTLTDPDGGGEEKIVTARTRAVPKAFAGGRTLHVYPPAAGGQKMEPAFVGLRDAYAQAQPGDILLIHAGAYVVPAGAKLPSPGARVERTKFSIIGARDYLLNKNGTAERPIVLRGAGDGEAIFDAGGGQTLFHVTGNYHYFENLTLQNGNGPDDIDGGLIFVDAQGVQGLVVRRCTLRDATYGIWAMSAANRGFVITDNEFLGRADWREGLLRSATRTRALCFTGQGHDISFNRIQRWYDGISHGGYFAKVARDPEGWALAIDIYNNDIRECQDDFLEADNVKHNVRILRNRFMNSGTSGISCSPVYGGPLYLVRNTVFNVVHGTALRLQKTPAGLLVYQNTFGAPCIDNQYWKNGHFRNNLFLWPFGSGVWTPATSSMDYDGFMANVKWYPRGPKKTEQFDMYVLRFSSTGKFPDGYPKPYRTPQALAAACGYEQHGILLNRAMLVTVPEFAWCRDAVVPIEEEQTFEPGQVDLRIKPGTAPVDAGCVLANITDGFSGEAPDLGALELGAPLPHYGPRPPAPE